MITLREFLHDDDRDGLLARFREDKVDSVCAAVHGLWRMTFPERAPIAAKGDGEAGRLRACLLMLWEMSGSSLDGLSAEEWRAMLGLDPAVPPPPTATDQPGTAPPPVQS